MRFEMKIFSLCFVPLIIPQASVKPDFHFSLPFTFYIILCCVTLPPCGQTQ